jgi:hypothetical protein
VTPQGKVLEVPAAGEPGVAYRSSVVEIEAVT